MYMTKICFVYKHKNYRTADRYSAISRTNYGNRSLNVPMAARDEGKMHFGIPFVHFTSWGFHSSHFPPVIESSLGWHVFIERHFLDGIMGQLTG